MKQVRIGIVGYGTVGRGTAEAIAANVQDIAARTGACLRVTAVCRRSPVPPEALPEGARFLADWRELVSAPDVDIVVETIGGTTVAREVVLAALERGKPVVTANKNLIAAHAAEVFALARRRGVPVGIEATVAGAVPVVRVLSEVASADRLGAVRGILNGTSNYILTRMYDDELSFDEALRLAQQAGYAEADPTFDVDGIDARDKLCILARLAFRCAVAPGEVPTTGIRHVLAEDMLYARRLGAKIRLLASADRHGDELQLSVRPWLVGSRSMLSNVDGAYNAVLLEGERTGRNMLYGRGAGGGPTGIAVLSDLMQMATDIAADKLRFRESIAANSGSVTVSRRSLSAPWYLRLTVDDRPGIVAQVANAIARQSANVDSVLQEPNLKKQRLSFVVTLEQVAEDAVAAAVDEINRMKFMLEPVLVLPIQAE